MTIRDALRCAVSLSTVALFAACGSSTSAPATCGSGTGPPQGGSLAGNYACTLSATWTVGTSSFTSDGTANLIVTGTGNPYTAVFSATTSDAGITSPPCTLQLSGTGFLASVIPFPAQSCTVKADNMTATATFLNGSTTENCSAHCSILVLDGTVLTGGLTATLSGEASGQFSESVNCLTQ
jgi:hypothetical protein